MFKKGDKVRFVNPSKNVGPLTPEVCTGSTYRVESCYFSNHYGTTELSLAGINRSVTADCFELAEPTTVTAPPGAITIKPFDPVANAASPVGLRFNQDKNRVELLCPIAMQACAAVLTVGAKKYAPNNWQKGMSWLSVTGCLLRHTFKFMAGEENDPETGLPHVDHILCNAMFLSNYHRTRREFDDRFKIPEQKS